MEKGLVVKKQIFIQKIQEDIRHYYDIDFKVTDVSSRNLGRGPMERSIWDTLKISQK